METYENTKQYVKTCEYMQKCMKSFYYISLLYFCCVPRRVVVSFKGFWGLAGGGSGPPAPAQTSTLPEEKRRRLSLQKKAKHPVLLISDKQQIRKEHRVEHFLEIFNHLIWKSWCKIRDREINLHCSKARWPFQLSCFPGLVVGQNQQRPEIPGSFGVSLLAFLHSMITHMKMSNQSVLLSSFMYWWHFSRVP